MSICGAHLIEQIQNSPDFDPNCSPHCKHYHQNGYGDDNDPCLWKVTRNKNDDTVEYFAMIGYSNKDAIQMVKDNLRSDYESKDCCCMDDNCYMNCEEWSAESFGTLSNPELFRIESNRRS
jgi:hypothetical protein